MVPWGPVGPLWFQVIWVSCPEIVSHSAAGLGVGPAPAGPVMVLGRLGSITRRAPGASTTPLGAIDSLAGVSNAPVVFA